MADTNLGDLTKAVSQQAELLNNANVSGHGAPTHIPQRSTQTYVDVDTGIKAEWWGGVWH